MTYLFRLQLKLQQEMAKEENGQSGEASWSEFVSDVWKHHMPDYSDRDSHTPSTGFQAEGREDDDA